MNAVDYSSLRGFNYQPSYGSTGLEMWQYFNEAIITHEIALGRAYFPAFRAVRWWLSFDAYQRDRSGFLAKFERVLQIAHTHGLIVMPVLFNRWHDGTMDYGGIYFESIGGALWKEESTNPHKAFIDDVVGSHANDPRIFAWDLCNEPFTGTSRRFIDGVALEYGWLESIYHLCKKAGAVAPLTVGIHWNDKLDGLKQIDPISDILSFHPYFIGALDDKPLLGEFYELLDSYLGYARSVNKPLLASETFWGAKDDAVRVALIKIHASALKERGIGWLAYALHHSICPDLHREEFAPLGFPQNLAFIEADGTIRPGHEVINEY